MDTATNILHCNLPLNPFVHAGGASKWRIVYLSCLSSSDSELPILVRKTESSRLTALGYKHVKSTRPPNVPPSRFKPIQVAGTPKPLIPVKTSRHRVRLLLVWALLRDSTPAAHASGMQIRRIDESGMQIWMLRYCGPRSRFYSWGRGKYRLCTACVHSGLCIS